MSYARGELRADARGPEFLRRPTRCLPATPLTTRFKIMTEGDYSYFRYLAPARNQWITLAENHIFSPTVLNTARFSFSRTH